MFDRSLVGVDWHWWEVASLCYPWCSPPGTHGLDSSQPGAAPSLENMGTLCSKLSTLKLETATTGDQFTADLRTSGIILCMGSANERWHYIVTASLFGWAHTQNDPWYLCARSRYQAGTSNYIPQNLWDVITYPCLRYLLLAHKSSFGSCNLNSIENYHF